MATGDSKSRGKDKKSRTEIVKNADENIDVLNL